MKVLSLMVGPIMTNCYILCDEDARRDKAARYYADIVEH